MPFSSYFFCLSHPFLFHYHQHNHNHHPLISLAVRIFIALYKLPLLPFRCLLAAVLHTISPDPFIPSPSPSSFIPSFLFTAPHTIFTIIYTAIASSLPLPLLPLSSLVYIPSSLSFNNLPSFLSYSLISFLSCPFFSFPFPLPPLLSLSLFFIFPFSSFPLFPHSPFPYRSYPSCPLLFLIFSFFFFSLLIFPFSFSVTLPVPLTPFLSFFFLLLSPFPFSLLLPSSLSFPTFSL